MNLQAALRTAILANDPISDLLGRWQNVPAVLTKRPIPQEAEALPCIVVSPDISVQDVDLLTVLMPVIIKDIAVYGNHGNDAEYRTVEDVAWKLRDLFHRQPKIIEVDGYSSVTCVATGPFVGPTDDDKKVARIVSLTITLYRRLEA